MIRILSAQFSHETNTFSTSVTDAQAFERRTFVRGGQAVASRFAGTRTELGSHLDSARRHGWQLIQPYAAHATPAGLVSRDMLDYAVGALIDEAAHVDGAILALHGAMVAQGEDDAEGYLLERLRQALGPDKPLVATLDMHANVTERMARHANALIAYRTYPHVDQYDVAAEAAALVQRMLRTRRLTRTHLLRLPLLDGCDHGRTHGEGAMPQLLAMAEQIRQAHPELDAVSITAGFPWADIAEAGPAVCVITKHGPEALAPVLPLMQRMWQTRGQRSVRLLPLPEIVAEIRGGAPAAAPIVVADFSDNPGHGAPGDGVALVRALHEAGIGGVAAACICDPQAVSACRAAGQGAKLELAFGARCYPDLYGPPMKAVVRVDALTGGDMVYEGPMRQGTRISLGPTAVISFDGIEVILSSNNLQVQDLQFFRAQGIEPRDRRVLVVKSQQHFRAAFAPIASQVLLADSGGFVSPDLARLPYRRVRRPVWPLDPIADTPMPSASPAS